MHPEVLAALEASIKHWEENVAAQFSSQAQIWSDHCALCGLFYVIGRPENIPYCTHKIFGRCPVYAQTGENYCGDSPWEKAQKAHDLWLDGSIPREVWQAAAQAELDFLKSLRPK